MFRSPSSGPRLDTRLTRIEAEIKTQTASIDAQNSRIDVLQPSDLAGDLAADRSTGRSPIFGLLYKVLTTPPG